MFPSLQLTVSRVRALCLAAVVGLLGSATLAASAQASGTSSSSPPAGGAIIASASGAAVDTTSTSGATAAVTGAGRSTSAPQSGELTLNSSDTPASSQARPPVVKTAASSQVGQSSFEAPIVGSTAPRASASTPHALAQIQSDGPIVASSGSAVAAHRSREAIPVAHRPSPLSRASRAYAPDRVKQASSGPTVEINASGVQIFISPTLAQRPVPPQVQVPASGRTVGEIGSPNGSLAGFLPATPRPAPAPGGPANTTLFTSASAAVGGSALLGIDILFTVAALLVGVAWRRRSWDLPVRPGQSALLSLALDRPG